MMTKLRVKNRGFSLIELIWVMLIGSIVMAAIYSIVFGSKDTLVRGERDARTSYRARRTMRRLVEDFRLAGYGLPGGELGIITAKENELIMVADLDKDGMTETIRYYLSHTSELGKTPNPNDRILYKSVNGENPGLVLAVGLSSLSLGFYDPNRVDLLDPDTDPKRVNPLKDLNYNGENDLKDIRLITVRVVFELAMPDKHGGYKPYAVSSSISPRNLKLLGGGGGAGSDSVLVLDADPDVIEGDGVSTSDLTATAMAMGSPMIGQTVYCYVISGEGSISPSPMIDNGDGTYSSTFTSPTTLGEAIIMAVDSVASLSATTKITLTGPPVTVTVSAEPDTVIADGTSTSLVTATVVDSFGTPVPGQTVTIEITDNNTGASMQGTVLDKGNGNYTRIYKSSTTTGTDEVTATCEGYPASVSITTREGACEIQVWAVPETLIADTSYYCVVTALVTACDGDSLPGELVTIDFDENLANVTWVSDVVDSGNGIYTRIMQAGLDTGLVIVVASDAPLFAYDSVFVKEAMGDVSLGQVIQVKLGDFEEDGNGDLDIFVISKADTELFVFLNAGNDFHGNLNQFSVIEFDAEGEVKDFALGNFDSLKTDVSLILRKNKKIELAMNDQNGGFEETSFKYDISNNGRSAAAGDIDGDGDIDVLAGTDGKRTEVWLNDGDAGLTFHTKLTHFDKPNAICLVDLGEDTLGDLDIVVGTENKELEVFFNDGGGSFHTDHIYLAAGKVNAVETGDMNGDGYVDIVCGTGKAKKFEIWLNNGDGTFPLTPDYTYNVSDEVLALGIADVQEDSLGDLDVVVGPKDGLMTVWFNDGTGALTVSEKTYPHPGKITGLDTGDLGEDDKGDTDIVTGTDEGGEGGNLRMYLGKGDGTFLKRE